MRKIMQSLLLLAASVSAHAGIVIGMGVLQVRLMVTFSPAKAIGFRAGIASTTLTATLLLLMLIIQQP